MKRLVDHGYKKELREDIRNLFWGFLKAHTSQELEQRRQELHFKLKQVDIDYLKAY